MRHPETRYAERHDALIAYQVFGDGDVDLVVSLGLGSNCDHVMDVPNYARSFAHLARYFRVILFDRLGTGHSDPLPHQALPTWEDWTDELLTVMDAAGSRRAVIYGERDGGIMALLFAALHPERTAALVLSNTTACYLAQPDFPEGMNRELAEEFVARLRREWGSEAFTRVFNTTLDAHALRMAARILRGAVTPRQAAAFVRYLFDLDARAVLPSIKAPTLVFHRVEQPVVPLVHGQCLAGQIPNAELVVLPGATANSLFNADDADAVIGRLVEFGTGALAETDANRALVTLLFADIVGSTALAARLSDAAWHEKLERAVAIVRGELARHGGREVNKAGDGFFIAFDRPTRAIRCARALGQALAPLELQLRCGVHTGEVTVNGDDYSGLAVHVAARVAATAAPGETWVTETVKALAMGSGIDLEARGQHALKGVPEDWGLYAVSPRHPAG